MSSIPRVLVVDDEAAIVEGLTMVLEAESIESASASDASSAVALIGETFYAVILADLCLKTTADGLRLLEEIRRLSPQSRVITLSGYVTPELHEEVTRRGVSVVLHKPMAASVIIAAIRDLLWEIEQEHAANPEDDLTTLYEKVRKVLYSIPRRKYGLSHEAAEDVAQQAWLLFLEKRMGVRDPRRWLSGTAVNLSRQELSRAGRTDGGDPDMTFDAIEGTAPQHADVFAVRQALQRLDARSRDLCEWIGIEGFSYDEVSNATAMPLGSVGPMYMRAKTRLRETLA